MKARAKTREFSQRVRKRPSKPTKDQLQRSGPAPRINYNEHSSMFRPGANRLRKKRPAGPVASKNSFDGDCYNCGEKGHKAADCPHPKRPRQQRRQTWRDKKLTGLVGELKGKVGEALTTGSDVKLTEFVEAFAFHMENMGRLGEDANDGSGPHEDEEAKHQQSDEGGSQTFTSEEVYQTPSPANPLQTAEDDEGALEGDVSPLPEDELDNTAEEEESQYPYLEVYQLLAQRSSIEPLNPEDGALPEIMVSMEQCATYLWPAEFETWAGHSAKHLRVLADWMVRSEGKRRSGISREILIWISIQSAWLHEFLQFPLPLLVMEFIDLAHVAIDNGSAVEDSLTYRLSSLTQPKNSAVEVNRFWKLQASMRDSLATMCTAKFLEEAKGAFRRSTEPSDRDVVSVDTPTRVNNPQREISTWDSPGPLTEELQQECSEVICFLMGSKEITIAKLAWEVAKIPGVVRLTALPRAIRARSPQRVRLQCQCLTDECADALLTALDTLSQDAQSTLARAADREETPGRQSSVVSSAAANSVGRHLHRSPGEPLPGNGLVANRVSAGEQMGRADIPNPRDKVESNRRRSGVRIKGPAPTIEERSITDEG